MVWQPLEQISKEHFHRAAGSREKQRLAIGFEQRQPNIHTGLHTGFPQAQFLVDQRRVIQQEMLLSLGCPTLVNQANAVIDQHFSQLNRIGDRGRGEDEFGKSTVESRYALEATHQVGKM